MADKRDNDSRLNGAERKERLLLVVDGEASQLYYTGMLLQRLAYAIYTAKTAEEALEIMAITLPSLVLAEVSLPQMDGIEFLKQIKNNPRTKDIPVVVYTSKQEPAVRDACFAAGCSAYLVKPIDPETLYASIQKITEPTPRNFVRLAIRLKVIIGDEATGGAPTEEYITALSENGMYVSTSRPQKAGTWLPIILMLKDARIRIVGNVLYSFEAGQGPLRTPGMGVKFERILPDDLKLIHQFINEQLTHDIVQK
jgi:CheY-like chemotaxis protein